MQRRKQNLKKSCPHRLQKRSLDSKVKPMLKDSITYKSPEKQPTARVQTELLLENKQLKQENIFYQQYFATFQRKYKQQKRQNKKLRKQIQELSQEPRYSLNKRCQTAFSTSEKTITNKLSRATKCSRANFSYE